MSSTRTIVTLAFVVVVLVFLVALSTSLQRTPPEASVAPSSCIPLHGTYNPSIPPPKQCCSGLKAVLQTPRCAPGGCRYSCETSSGAKSSKAKTSCVPQNGTYNPSIYPPRQCCKGLRAVLRNPGCPDGGCMYMCQKSRR